MRQAQVRSARERVAERYRLKGYEVSVDPSADLLPDFLHSLHPEIIARRGSENVIVGTNAGGLSAEEQRRIVEAIRTREGWRFDFAVAEYHDPDWDPPADLPTFARLRSELAKQAQTADLRTRLVMLWSIFEAAARHRLLRRGERPTDRLSLLSLINFLIHHGDLDPDDFERLLAALRLRNSVAHGYVDHPIDQRLLDEVGTVVSKLLEDAVPAE